MAGVELANAWVTIKPSTREIAPEINKAIKGVDMSGAGQSMGKRLSGAMGKALKAGAIGVGTAVGGTLAGAIAKGMGRLTAIEGAEAKLTGLGHSAEAVSGIMDNALASVKGTAHGLGEAASVSAGMVAAGIKPGKELEQTLRTVGDTAAIAGRSMEDVGLIFGSVAARGKLQGDDMLQLMSSGIPVLQLLADETGKTSEKISEMVSRGEIDFATFERAMSKGMGGAAQEMGKTFQGSLANMGAAMGRFGATLIGPAFDAAPAVFNAIGDAFDQLEGKVAPVAEAIGQKLTPHVEKFAQNLGPWLDTALDQAGNVFADIGDIMTDMGPSFMSIGESLLTITQNISIATWTAFTGVLNALAPVVEHVLVPMLDTVAKFAAQNPGAVQAIVYAFLGFKAVGAVAGPIGKLTGGVKALWGAFTQISKLFQIGGLVNGFKALGSFAGKGVPIVSQLGGVIARVGKVMGPILKIGGILIRFINPWVAGITAVVGALTWFFTSTETGQGIWQGFVDAIVAGWEWVKGAFATAWEYIQLGWSQFIEFISMAWETWLKPVFEAIGQFVMNTLGVVFSIAIGLAIAAWNLLSAAWQAAWNNIIKPVIDGFAAAMQWLWNNVVLPVVDWIKAKWSELSTLMSAVWQVIKTNVIDAWANAFNRLWQNVISPVIGWIVGRWNWLRDALNSVWQFIKTNIIDPWARALNWLWQNVVQPVLGLIAQRWDWLKTQMHTIWTWINNNVIERFKSALNTLKSFFGTVVEGIRSVWNGLKRALATPINFMINRVYNDGIAEAWDTIGGFLPLNPKTAKRLSPIGGYARGGAIRGQGTGTSDDIPAWLSNGEHVLTAADVKAFGGQGVVYAIREALKKGQGFTFDGEAMALLPEHINNRRGDLVGAAPSMFPAFKDGGEVRPMWELQLERGHKWAKSRHGRPYVFGGSAHGGGGTDCSGFMSGIADVMAGGNGARQWATMAFNGGSNRQYPSGPQGFVAGLKGNTFSIGVTNGGAAGGHTAGTLGATSRVGAVNVESGGSPSMVKYGTGAAGANDSYLRTHYHLPIGPGGAFVIGKGSGGPSPEQMKEYISGKISKAIDTILGPIKNRLPSGPPAWKDIPSGVYEKGKKSLSDKMASVVAGLGDKLGTVYAAAQEVGDIVRNAGRGAMEWAGRALGLTVHDQGGWLQSGNLALNLSGKPEPVLTNAQWAMVANGIREIGRLIPALKAQTEAIAKNVEADPTRHIQAWLQASTPKEQYDLAMKVPGLDTFLSPFGGVVGQQDALVKAHMDQSKAAAELTSAEKALAAARAGGEAEKVTEAEKKYAEAKDAVKAASIAAGHAEIAMAVEVANLVADLVDHIISSVMKARVEVYKALATMMDAIGEIAKMAANLREQIGGLLLDQAMAAIELAAAERNVRITRMDGVRAQLEGARTLAEAQAAFDAQRRNDMRLAQAAYIDLSLAYDRFRWAMAAGNEEALAEMAAWSDESHALFADLMAAQTNQRLLEKQAQRENLKAAYEATLAMLDLRSVTADLGVATQKLAAMSGGAFGFSQVGATVTGRWAELMAEKAQLQAEQASIGTWINPINWFTSMPAAQRRIKQIDQQLKQLEAHEDFQNFDSATRAEIDKAVASSTFMGLFGAGDKVAQMIQNSALGDPGRALEQIKFEQSLIDLKASQDALRLTIEKRMAEIGHRRELDPLDTEIQALEQEKASHETWAEYWRAENAGVRDALKELAQYQADSAASIKQLADNARGEVINLYGSTASMDDVERMLGDLGFRVNRLENPKPTGADVVGARR